MTDRVVQPVRIRTVRRVRSARLRAVPVDHRAPQRHLDVLEVDLLVGREREVEADQLALVHVAVREPALELAARAHVPRQKIYEVLDSLVEKGFAQVVQEKTKLFSAVEPSLAVPGFLARRAQVLQHELNEQSRLADGLAEDLKTAYSEGQGGRGTLDYLRIVSEPTQTAAQYRRMIGEK